MRFLFTASTGLALAVAMGAAAHAYTIDTVPYWDGGSNVASWGGSGAGSTNTYGETFIAPGGSLTNFTFYIDDFGVPATFVAEVYAWNGSLTGGSPPQGTGGSPLYTSAPMSTSGAGDLFQAVTINTGGVPLVAGQQYVIDLYDGSSDGAFAAWDLITPGPGVPYDGGFVYNNGPSNAALWGVDTNFGSLAYSATFTGAVPEPSSWALMLAGFGAIGLAFRARNRLVRAAT